MAADNDRTRHGVAIAGILRRMSPEALSELISSIAHNLVAAGQAGALTDELIPPVDKLAVMRPKDRAHGDWASNIAMQLAKKAGMKPRDLAEPFAAALAEADGIAKVEVAGPGFINITLDSASAAAVVDTVLAAGAMTDTDKHLNKVNEYGRNAHLGGQTLNLEFVSANPTGPIHIGGTRWAAVGDAMARVPEANGAKVVREYYFNDHGEQINRFAKSLVAAWAEANNLGEAGYQTETPCDGYKGAYINEIAARVQAEAESDGVDLTALAHQDQGLNDDGEPLGEADTEVREEFRKRAVPMMFDEIQKSMKDFRVNFDVWFHENSLYADGKVDAAIEELKSRGDIFDKDGATWFESTKHGDDKDRVIIKSNGEFAYFAADIAYYWDKRHRAENPADVAIYMLGADHHGYIERVRCVCDALGYPGKFEVLLGQLVNLLRNGKPVRMSKRKGTMVTLQELVDEVGSDAARYTLISKSSNQMVDFDIEAVKKRDNSNPVYYVQYAHARVCSILRRAADVTPEQADEMGMKAVAAKAIGENVDYSLLTDPTELALSRKLNELTDLIASCARDRAPFRLTHFAEELAGDFHSFYAACQVLPSEGRPVDPELSRARLAACDAVRVTLALVLTLVGVSAPEQM